MSDIYLKLLGKTDEQFFNKINADKEKLKMKLSLENETTLIDKIYEQFILIKTNQHPDEDSIYKFLILSKFKADFGDAFTVYNRFKDKSIEKNRGNPIEKIMDEIDVDRKRAININKLLNCLGSKIELTDLDFKKVFKKYLDLFSDQEAEFGYSLFNTMKDIVQSSYEFKFPEYKTQGSNQYEKEITQEKMIIGEQICQLIVDIKIGNLGNSAEIKKTMELQYEMPRRSLDIILIRINKLLDKLRIYTPKQVSKIIKIFTTDPFINNQYIELLLSFGDYLDYYKEIDYYKLIIKNMANCKEYPPELYLNYIDVSTMREFSQLIKKISQNDCK